MKYHIWTIGCQMNKADSQRAAQALEDMGLLPSDTADDADLIVLNTCVVRQSAEDKACHRLSSLKPLIRDKPGTVVAVMGCLVGEDTASLRRRFPFVDVFLRPSDTSSLLSFIMERLPTKEREAAEARSAAPACSYVPVVLGCDNLCTYCVVRMRRGRQRSRLPGEIVAEVQSLVREGSREVTLLGQNVDAYGHDLPDGPDLADLLRLVHDVDNLWRIRFLTSHPNDMSERIIDAVATLDRVCEHIELPVQAGHDLTLKRMARGYTVEQYRRLVAMIRQRVPGVSLGTDIIVGFPGETEEHFRATHQLLAEERFDVVHVAAYSPRPGTAAARLEDDVCLEEKGHRRQLIEDLQQQIATEINGSLLGSITDVLVEEEHRGRWKGRTRTNKLVFFTAEGDWRSKLARVEITWTGPWSMQGKLVAPRST